MAALEYNTDKKFINLPNSSKSVDLEPNSGVCEYEDISLPLDNILECSSKERLCQKNAVLEEPKLPRGSSPPSMSDIEDNFSPLHSRADSILSSTLKNPEGDNEIRGVDGVNTGSWGSMVIQEEKGKNLKRKNTWMPNNDVKKQIRNKQINVIVDDNENESSSEVNCKKYFQVKATDCTINLNKRNTHKILIDLKKLDNGFNPNYVKAVKDVIEITCTSESQVNALKNLDILDNIPVTINEMTKSNFFKVIVHGISEDINPEDLMEASGAHKLLRMTKRQGGQVTPTTSVILWYNHLPPDEIFIGYRKYKTKPFFDLPSRCVNCQSYSHRTKDCRKRVVCPRCSGPHKYNECKIKMDNEGNLLNKELLRCPNCNEQHSAGFKNCNTFLEKFSKMKRDTERRFERAKLANVPTVPSLQLGDRAGRHAERINRLGVQLSNVVPVLSSPLGPAPVIVDPSPSFASNPIPTLSKPTFADLLKRPSTQTTRQRSVPPISALGPNVIGSTNSVTQLNSVSKSLLCPLTVQLPVAGCSAELISGIPECGGVANMAVGPCNSNRELFSEQNFLSDDNNQRSDSFGALVISIIRILAFYCTELNFNENKINSLTANINRTLVEFFRQPTLSENGC